MGLARLDCNHAWRHYRADSSVIHHLFNHRLSMKLYIATPINARPEQGFRNKYKAAQKRVRELKEIIKTDHRFYGYSFVSSFDVNKSQNISEAIAMGNCIQAVIECDAIYLDHAWQSSKGCNLEYRAAKIYDKEIYEYDKL